jgi:hypothetical protein
MAQYHKVNGGWEVIEDSIEKNTVDSEKEKEAMTSINRDLNPEDIKKFSKHGSSLDYMLKLYIPRYYNDGTKVSDSVIAEILFKISEAIGGASTNVGKGYWIDKDVLYEDKNVYVETVLKGYDPDRATLLGEYLSSVIAKALKQEGALVVIYPILATFIDKGDFDKNIKEIKETIDKMNSEPNDEN